MYINTFILSQLAKKANRIKISKHTKKQFIGE